MTLVLNERLIRKMKSAVTSETLKTPYVGIDVLTGDWVGGDHYYINSLNEAVLLCQLNLNKNGKIKRTGKKHKEEFWILPESLHVASGFTPDGKIDYEPVNLSWFNWSVPLRKWNFKESD